MNKKTNIILIMTDQQRADLVKREGYSLDTMPFLDKLAGQGTWFKHAYTVMPVCRPARISLLTGRFPTATHVRTNHNTEDAFFTKDIFHVMKEGGYKTALIGKNHTHLEKDRTDFWWPCGHNGAAEEITKTDKEEKFDAYLKGLRHRTDVNPAPFGPEQQLPFRMVNQACSWINKTKHEPFFLWLSFPEPHNPYQVCEPYYSMFSPEHIPANTTTQHDLTKKGFKFKFTRDLGIKAFSDYAQLLPRTKANYHGMLRLIDDQLARLHYRLDEMGLLANTLIIFTSDHGDFAGEYGMIRKGPELPEVLTRIPMVFSGPGIKKHDGARKDFISIVDIFPTLCELADIPVPEGVQGRSLAPMLLGQDYPQKEFSSVYCEHGFGGLHYTGEEDLTPEKEGALIKGKNFDCLNSWTQSGQMRMLRKDKWKICVDMMGNGQLYDLNEDPYELNNLWDNTELSEKKNELLTELMSWTLRAQDPLPLPQKRYVMKKADRNWYHNK